MGLFNKIFGGAEKAVKSVTSDWIPSSVRDIYTPAAESVTQGAEKLAGKAYDYTVGPNNPVSSGLDAMGFHKAAGLVAAPSWDELARPAQAFANDFDQKAGILPPSWRQYAEPVVAAALNFIPGVGPLISAGFSTAYNAGNMQRNQKGMDWGKVGVDAAKNFGTAAIQMGASKLLSNAQTSQMNNLRSAQAGAAATPAGVGAPTGAGTMASARAASMPLGGSPVNVPISQSGSMMGQGFLTSQAANDAAVGLQGAGALRNSISQGSALEGFNNPMTNTSLPSPNVSSIPKVAGSSASAMTSSQGQSYSPSDTPQLSTLDKAYNKTLSGLTPQEQAKGQLMGVAQTLASGQQNAPLEGFDTSGGLTGGDTTQGYQFGDQLNAFRDPTATGKISPQELNDMTMKIGYNNYQQQQGARDTYLPAGQTEPNPNTPYSGQLNQINQGTEKSYEDLLKEVDNYNAINSIMEANPSYTLGDVNNAILNPTQADPAFQPWLQGLQPYIPQNTSLLGQNFQPSPAMI